jgi:hypothetical protein
MPSKSALVFLLFVVMAIPGAALAATSKNNDVDLVARGLKFKNQNGTTADANSKVTATVVRNAKGIPVKLVNLKISNVDSRCFDTAFDASPDPGPEVTAKIGNFKLKPSRGQHAMGDSSIQYRFDPIATVRTINGVEHQLRFLMDGKEAREAELDVDSYGSPGTCAIHGAYELKKVKAKK